MKKALPHLLFLGLLLAFAVLLPQSGWAAKLSGVPDLPKALHSPGKMVLLDFYVPWCGTCQMMDPYIKRLSSQHKERIQVIHLNADKPVNAPYLQRYRIQATPTYVLFDRHGKAVYKMEYEIDPRVLQHRVKQAVQVEFDQDKLCRTNC